MTWDRREFVKLSTASLLIPRLLNESAAVQATGNQSENILRFARHTYTWEWSEQTDTFRLLDGKAASLPPDRFSPRSS